MTHKLITKDQAAGWLHIPVESVEELVSKGWLVPAVPVEPSCFDATKINQVKKRLRGRRKKARWEWSIVGASFGIAVAVWLIGRSDKKTEAVVSSGLDASLCDSAGQG